MTTPGRMARATGLTIMLISASIGMNSGAGGVVGLILSFMGILAGANLIAVGVRMANDPAARMGPAVFAGASALAAFLRRHLPVVGLVIASCAVAAVSGGEAGPVLCFGMSALLLLGLSLTTIGILGQ